MIATVTSPLRQAPVRLCNSSLQLLLVFAVLGALGTVASAAPSVGTSAQASPAIVPFEVIVKFSPTAKIPAIAAQLPNVAIDTSSPYVTTARLEVPFWRVYSPQDAKTATLALLSQLRQRADVEYAQLNYLFDFSFVPNDPLYSQQWSYPLISLPTAWDLTRGSSAIGIAILDSGRSGHPDLNGRWASVEFNAPAPGTPATDNGTWRHGTHVAAIAGAATNNGIGGAGVCHGCQLMNVKIGDSTTGLTTTWIVASINWAIDNGARVMNMSFENPLACTQANQPAMRAAILRAADNGVVMVAAAGNNAVNVATVSPASCPGVIAVAATDRGNNLATYSSRGPNIGVAAPGGASFYGAGIGCPADSFSSFNANDFEGAVSAWTTSPGTGNTHCYRHLGGTSMASPHVAGTAGLMLSVNPRLRPDQVRSLLAANATPLPACGSNCGPGLLNAYGAVNKARTTPTGPCSADGGTTKLGCTIDSIAQYVNSNGALVESIYAYGLLWQFDASGTQLGTTKNLRAFPRYSSVGGPCTFAPAGQECVMDSATVLDYPGFGYLESVTAYGRYWNFDQNGNGLAGNGSLLSSVSRYASGPCAYASGLTTCRFDTRALFNPPEWGGLYESISAYGRYWNYDAVGNLVGTDTLVSVPRYASGPCLYAPTGTPCTFTSRELRSASGGGIIETITAYGRYFEWGVNGLPTANHNLPLSSIPRLN
jgi:subtilisin family serine protease